MTEKELRRLTRAQLLEILIEQTAENERLKASLAEAEQRIEEKNLDLNSAGSIAEAALKVNGVFEAAQAAAEQYLENIRQSERICRSREEQTERICAQMLAEAEKNAELITSSAQRKADSYWDVVSEKLERFYTEHQGLKELLKSTQGN